jgi:molybdate transport system ATP-binding protein
MVDTGDGNADRAVWLDMEAVDDGHLQVSRFAAREDEAWCVYGDNRSGIDRFVELFRRSDDHLLTYHRLKFSKDFGIVSFRDQQEVFEQEVRNDESDFLDRMDPGTPARNFLAHLQDNYGLVEQFNLVQVLDSGYRQLSSGESRKLLILKAITEGAAHLIIENPYDGLDSYSRVEFDRIMTLLLERGIAVLLILSSRGDIPDWCTHLAWLEKGRLAGAGTRAEVMRDIKNGSGGDDWGQILEFQDNTKEKGPAEELVRLVNGRARYGERTIFSGFNFHVLQGQHTLITGPNGAGKSTLLGVITGDHQDCYTNELYLFGRRRGSGESIWQIKKEMGIVSPALHREHYIPGNSLHIVVSGFFDSIGLYRRPSDQQWALARSWLGVLGLGSLEKVPFRTLGYGEQRLLLIARALIKLPKILVLDEPTHGLDDTNRAHLLDFLEMVVDRQISTIIYVSHRGDEFRGFFRQHLSFESLPDR